MNIRCKFCNNFSVHGCKTCGIAICEDCSNELECPNCNPELQGQCNCELCTNPELVSTKCVSCGEFVCKECIKHREGGSDMLVVCKDCMETFGSCSICGEQATEFCSYCHSLVCDEHLETNIMCKECYAREVQTVEDYE